MIILIVSSTSLGLLLSENSKKKVTVCSELVSFCDLLLLDLDYRITPAKELLENTLKNENLSHLNFISGSNLIEKKNIVSCLSKSENEDIAAFLYSLGKSDVNSQKKLINAFKERIKNSMNIYSQKYKKDSKLYLSFGFFFGIVFSLIWI